MQQRRQDQAHAEQIKGAEKLAAELIGEHRRFGKAAQARRTAPAATDATLARLKAAHTEADGKDAIESAVAELIGRTRTEGKGGSK